MLYLKLKNMMLREKLEMPELPGGSEDNSKRREVSLKGGRGSFDRYNNEGRVYLRSGVIDGSGWRRLWLRENNGS
jgi:hypothetical protein